MRFVKHVSNRYIRNLSFVMITCLPPEKKSVSLPLLEEYFKRILVPKSCSFCSDDATSEDISFAQFIASLPFAYSQSLHSLASQPSQPSLGFGSQYYVDDYYLTGFFLFAKENCVRKAVHVAQQLTDGTSRAGLCWWNNSSKPFSFTQASGMELSDVLKQELLLEAETLITPEFISWTYLSREAQKTGLIDLLPSLKEKLFKSVRRLRTIWFARFGLRCIVDTPLGNLVPSLMLALLQHLGDTQTEDFLIVHELMSSGVSLGFKQQVTPSCIWSDKVKLPKHTGFDLIPATEERFRNYQSAVQDEEKVIAVLQHEVEKGRMREATSEEIPYVHVCKLAAIPKKHGDVRLIDDHRRSGFNERCKSLETCGLPNLKSVAFVLLLQNWIARHVSTATSLAYCETDVVSAFRHVPVAYDDCLMLGNKISDKVLIHLRLCFGARFSPVQWIRTFSVVQRLIKRS
eukprot:GHVQ01033685.1.p1 GENE.GHVQ01033685.1~~GHVQ01033685.1.p1  ORF type:complete len:459 (-),score=21.37 GHVQ01033685.1:883-2259(-)